MSILLRLSLGSGAIIASLSGSFAQDLWLGGQAQALAQARAEAARDSQRAIFCNDTTDGRGAEVILGGKVVGQEPAIRIPIPQ